jgi:hypothetical protein
VNVLGDNTDIEKGRKSDTSNKVGLEVNVQKTVTGMEDKIIT